MPTKEITRPPAPAKTARRRKSVPAAQIIERLRSEREAGQ